MPTDRYVCCDERRRELVAATSPAVDISGIDYIEVHAGVDTTLPTLIDVVLVRPLTNAAALALTGANFRLTGGVRFKTPKIAETVALSPGAGSVMSYQLTIPGGQLTDFSQYRLAIVAGATNPAPPSFIDPRLSAVDFSFKIACPSDFDCAPDCDGPDETPPPDPVFDYRIRDYPGFRRQILDRLAELIPGFREDDPVDLTTTLAEIAAYKADHQSYRLDWVGTEAFLTTARSRTSLARHARLVDYALGEGASARVFARFAFTAGNGVVDGVELKAATPLLVRTEGQPPVIRAGEYRRALTRDSVVFETVAPLRLWGWRSVMAFHSWTDDECRLPRGSTAATLIDTSGGPGALAPGDLLILAETRSPQTGFTQDARPERRHAVRLTRVTPTTDILVPGLALVTVEWAEADALPFDLVIQARLPGALGAAASLVCAEAWGNVMLADHGLSLPPSPHLGLPPSDVEAMRPRLTPPAPIDGETWRPVLDRPNLAHIAPVKLDAPVQAPANDLARVDPGKAVAALNLDDDFAAWEARRDLLEAGPFSRQFVIETGIDNVPAFRFGDGVNGLPPSAGAVMTARGRFGFGLEGNIGIGALAHVVVPTALQGANLAVSNPLPGRGGAAEEPASSIRLNAPQAFRVQERAVTAADYAEAAMRHPEVANAYALPRFTGAWQTMVVFIDRKGGLPVDKAFHAEMMRHLEFFRLMGFDVAVRGAVSAPLDMALRVCARDGQLRSTVAARVFEALGSTTSPDGLRGFFHPDNFTFGSPLYLSRLVAAVMAVEGVESVMVLKAHRLGRLPQTELPDGVIRPGDFEVLQLRNDPSFPEEGRLALSMGGGR